MAANALSECGVIVLGGTAGVGFETAARFAEEGARVAIIGRHPERGAIACAKLRERASGGLVQFIKADASLPEDAIRAAELAHSLLGSIDVLMCTTGPSEPPRLLHNIPIENIRLLCKSHNLMKAEQHLGRTFMAKFRKDCAAQRASRRRRRCG